MDAVNEAIICERVSKMTGLTIERTDDMHPVDFILRSEHGIECVVELKSRNIKSTDYNTIYLSKAKREAVEKFAWDNDTDPFFLVWFKGDDVLKSIALGITRDFGEPEMKGRFDRGDKTDVEPMYLVNISSMKTL